MAGVTIRDGTEPGAQGGLEFDLAEMLAALGARVKEAVWRGRGLQYVSSDDQVIDCLERLGSEEDVSGAELLAILPELRQIIDGEFEARTSPGAAPWVTLRAVDSSWWEVYADDPNVIGAVRE